MYEFILGKKVWEVFSTKEWEGFSAIFHKRCVANVNRCNIEGIKITKLPTSQDGRKRLQVKLPDLDWTLLNLPKGRLVAFPLRKIKEGCYHAPKYLDFVLQLLDVQEGNYLKDMFDKKICKLYGTAKLINIGNDSKIFTVIIYGIKVT